MRYTPKRPGKVEEREIDPKEGADILEKKARRRFGRKEELNGEESEL
jgi:hypothetical protein